MKTAILALLLTQPTDLDAVLKHVFNGPGPSAVVGDTSTPRLARTTVEELPDGTVLVCYWHKDTSAPYACIA